MGNNFSNQRIYVNCLKKREKKHGKTVLLVKNISNTIVVLIFKPLIESGISHEKLVSVNEMLMEYNDMKKWIKNSQSKNEGNM